MTTCVQSGMQSGMQSGVQSGLSEAAPNGWCLAGERARACGRRSNHADRRGQKRVRMRVCPCVFFESVRAPAMRDAVKEARAAS